MCMCTVVCMWECWLCCISCCGLLEHGYTIYNNTRDFWTGCVKNRNYIQITIICLHLVGDPHCIVLVICSQWLRHFWRLVAEVSLLHTSVTHSLYWICWTSFDSNNMLVVGAITSENRIVYIMKCAHLNKFAPKSDNMFWHHHQLQHFVNISQIAWALEKCCDVYHVEWYDSLFRILNCSFVYQLLWQQRLRQYHEKNTDTSLNVFIYLTTY